jgi:hypothetical protein
VIRIAIAPIVLLGFISQRTYLTHISVTKIILKIQQETKLKISNTTLQYSLNRLSVLNVLQGILLPQF